MKIHDSVSVALAIAFAVVNATAANFPVGTHLVKGTLKDWQNKVLTSSAAVTIQAVATNGTVIASTKVANPSEDGYNFLLQIPLFPRRPRTPRPRSATGSIEGIEVKNGICSMAIDGIPMEFAESPEGILQGSGQVRRRCARAAPDGACACSQGGQ